MEFGAVLRRMRKGAGLSQETIAEKLHMSRSNVSKLESNKLELKAIDLLNWCKVTNNPEVLSALYAAVDISIQMQPITQLITGFIHLGGIA